MTEREKTLEAMLVAAGITPPAAPATAPEPAKPIIRFAHDMFKGKTPEERKQIIRDMESQPDPDLIPDASGKLRAVEPRRPA